MLCVAGLTACLTAGVAAPAGAATPETFAAAAAPTKVRVGAEHQEFVVTAIVRSAADDVLVDLVDRDGWAVGGGYAETALRDRPLVYKVPVELYAEDLTGWGAMSWELAGFRGFEDDDADIVGRISTDVRAHSMLGLAASRSGTTVTMKGSARAYTPAVARYASWSGRPVSVQRWNGSAWVELARTTTDRNGNLSLKVTAAKGSKLRLTTPDTRSIWGATSSAALV